MSIQLAPEQERRIRIVVNAGAYHSAEEALDAAVAAVETAAAPDFEGTQEARTGPTRPSKRSETPQGSAEAGSVVRASSNEEPEELLLEGLNSGDPVQARTGPARPSKRLGTQEAFAEPGSVVRASSSEADENFWNRLRAETDTIAAEHQARKSIRES